MGVDVAVFSSGLTRTFAKDGIAGISPGFWRQALPPLTGFNVVDFTEGFESNDDGGWTFIASFTNGQYAVVFPADGPTTVNSSFPWFDIRFPLNEKEAIEDFIHRLDIEEEETFGFRYPDLITQNEVEEAIELRATYDKDRDFRQQILQGRDVELALLQGPLVYGASKLKPL